MCTFYQDDVYSCRHNYIRFAVFSNKIESLSEAGLAKYKSFTTVKQQTFYNHDDSCMYKQAMNIEKKINKVVQICLRVCSAVNSTRLD